MSRAMSDPRLDRYLAHATGISRRDAQRLVRRGRVIVAGQVERDPSIHVPSGAEVRVDGKQVELRGLVVLMLHKPPGVVSATRDARDRTVLDLVPAALMVRRLMPVGRLDKDTTGLLLLTNDGPLLHRLIHPRRHLPRTYRVHWTGALVPDAAARARAGLELADGTRCLPAELVIEADGVGEMTLAQGKYHQVKRMIAALGGRVTALHRVRFGPIELGDLPRGQVRELSSAELASLL